VSVDSDHDELSVDDHAELRRYEARLGSDVVGFIAYHAEPGRITLLHTQVDPAFEGKGFGSRLIGGALDDIRSRGLSVVPVCRFVRAYLERHPEYLSIVVER
jgi:uncharacterized protein